MSLAETCETEVQDLHEFFEAWFRGELPRTNDRLARLEAALEADFQQVAPDGTVRDRAAVIDAVAGRHGSRRGDTDPFRIEVEEVDARVELDDVCLLTYEEHQRTDGEWRGRRSSALFEHAPDAPGGVVWRHLHETWLGG